MKLRPLGLARRLSLRAGIVTLGFATLTGAAWFSAGLEPWRDAIMTARAPSDFTTDFVPAARIARHRAPGLPLNPELRTGNAEAVRLGAPPYMDVGVPFGAHPPTAILLVAALVPLGFPAAAAGWMLLSLVSLATVAWVAVACRSGARPNEHDPRRALRTRAIVLFALLTSWPPVLHNLEKGQWSLLLAGLLAGAWWSWRQGHDRAAGACIALAGAFKVMPLIVLLAFVGAPKPRRRRLWIGAAATLAATVAAATVALGSAPWSDFFRSAPINTRGWQTAPANTLSLWGALARLFVGGAFARALPLGAKGAGLAVAIWLIAAAALTLLVFRRARRGARASGTRADSDGDARSGPGVAADRLAATANVDLAAPFSAACNLAVVLNPLSWSHGAALLILPLALIAGDAKPTSRLALLATAIVLLTLPRQTLLAWAGPLPVGSGAGLILAAHLGGAMMLFWLALRPPPASTSVSA